MSYPLLPLLTTNYTTQVRVVRVVVHTPPTDDAYNHWSIYLLLEGEDGSIRINMRAIPRTINATVDLSKTSYVFPNSGLAYFDFPTRGRVQVRDLVRLIYRYQRHNYDMTPRGTGCRYWVYVIIHDWVQKGWIAANAASVVSNERNYHYTRYRPRTALPMEVGTFDTGRTVTVKVDF